MKGKTRRTENQHRCLVQVIPGEMKEGQKRGANALKVHLHLNLKDGGGSSGTTRSECAQCPPAFEAERCGRSSGRANAFNVHLQLKLKDGGRTKSECAQGPPAFEVERWWSVFVNDEERMRSTSTTQGRQASVGSSCCHRSEAIREDHIKSRGRCVGLHVLVFMFISAGDRFKNETVVTYLGRPQ
jgi:hypothetical protein